MVALGSAVSRTFRTARSNCSDLAHVARRALDNVLRRLGARTHATLTGEGV